MALLNRIIKASSNPGDIVLDPFCGCGTTVEAAENAGRQWIGIDITYASIGAIQERFRRNRVDIRNQIDIRGVPKTKEAVEETMLNKASPFYARKEFEKFCVAIVGGLPNNVLGADGGIDGRIPLRTGDGNERKQAILSVKSGKVDVKQVRELKALLNEKRVAGVFITRQPPTKPMMEFANTSGIYSPKIRKAEIFGIQPFPRIQILTLDDMLSGKRPQLPYLYG